MSSIKLPRPTSSGPAFIARPSVVGPVATIVMLRFFAWRQRASMSAYFTNSLTPPIGLGLLASLSRREFPSVGQRVARSLSERWPAALPRGECAFVVQGHRLALEGQPSRCPFLIRTGNGRQDARPYFARRPVAVLRNFRLGGGSRCFWLSLFCARCSCGSRRSL
jgi:hypothetical protein